LSTVFLSLLSCSPITSDYADCETKELFHTGNAAQIERPLRDNTFFGIPTSYFNELTVNGSLDIQFRINPTGAKDAEGKAIPFDKLKALVADALYAWSSIDDTDITFTVHPDSFPDMWSLHNGFSSITFETDETGPKWADVLPRTKAPYSEVDIRLNPSKKWVLPGQNSGDGDAFLFRTLAHEFGHAVGLDDLGKDCLKGCHHGDDADPIEARDNLMWHTGETMHKEIQTPQDGDKAGAVYCCPKPSGTLQFNQVWPSGLRITSDVTVPDGKTLAIATYPDTEIYFDSDVTLTVDGTLKTKKHYQNKSTKFVGADKKTFWGGIRINPGGTLSAGGPVLIRNAKVGLSLYDKNRISNGSNQITFSNCTEDCVYDHGDEPTFVEDSTPVEYTLSQNYPNPFNPTTTINYSLDQASKVNLVIYDRLGRKVATLEDEIKTPGNYDVTWNAEGFASGVYFCRIESGGSVVLTRKMLLMK
ncbi:T9SS type A sorting domain-containing protein, partial [Candidatus Latescibacterota bacterium]